MERKVIKHWSDLLKKEAALTIDENLNKLKGKILAPKKLEQANIALKKLEGKLPN